MEQQSIEIKQENVEKRGRGRPSKGYDKKKQIAIMLSPDAIAKLDLMASTLDINRSQLVEKLIQDADVPLANDAKVSDSRNEKRVKHMDDFNRQKKLQKIRAQSKIVPSAPAYIVKGFRSFPKGLEEFRSVIVKVVYPQKSEIFWAVSEKVLHRLAPFGIHVFLSADMAINHPEEHLVPAYVSRLIEESLKRSVDTSFEDRKAVDAMADDLRQVIKNKTVQ